jgi:hypothetical protein
MASPDPAQGSPQPISHPAAWLRLWRILLTPPIEPIAAEGNERLRENVPTGAS